MLCHAGRGIPALGRHAVEACERHPGMRLILAHAGISDLAWIWRPARELPNLYFDTSWWSPADLQALLTLVPPGQVLFASDAPYGTPTLASIWAMRHSLQAGLEPDAVRSVMGGQIERLLAGEEPADLGPAPGNAGLSRDPLLERVHTFLLGALGQLFAGQDAHELLALATLACDLEDDQPHADVARWIADVVARRGDFVPGGPERPPRFGPGLPFVALAATLARTPDVPLPASGFAPAGAG